MGGGQTERTLVPSLSAHDWPKGDQAHHTVVQKRGDMCKQRQRPGHHFRLPDNIVKECGDQRAVSWKSLLPQSSVPLRARLVTEWALGTNR